MPPQPGTGLPPIYVIGNAQPGPLHHLAAIAPGLSDVELRVLIELAQRAEPPEFTCRASTRVLALSTGCGRPNIQRALRTLAQRAFITPRAGTATRPGAFRVNFLLLGVASPCSHPPGSAIEPGFATKPGGGSAIEPGGGSATMPPPIENTDVAAAAPPVDIDTVRFDAGGVVDRLLQARAKDYTEAQLNQARQWLHGYAAKFPAHGGEQPHPPDNQVLAQFLSIAPWPRLLGVLYDLMAERKQSGHSYAWFVSVALQRIHGIKPDALKAARTELKLLRNAPRALAAKMKL